MPRLVLLDGPPGVGKSTLAAHLAQDAPLTLALDVDQLKHSLGRWDEDPGASGLLARTLALSLAGTQLAEGRDVFVGQYLARTTFIEQLERAAVRAGAQFVEILLVIDEATLRKRLTHRASDPARPEQAVNSRLVGPDDAAALIASLEGFRTLRPRMRAVDASGDLVATARAVRAVLADDR